MRIVVTGATGNVGRGVVAALEADPSIDDIIGVARRAPTSTSGRTRYACADVSRDDLVPLLADADVVIHLAWHFQPTHSPETTWRNNSIGSERVFTAAATAGVASVVHASSVGAYSPVADGDDEPRQESWPTHSLPGSCYGREKAYVERVLDTFEARHPDIRVVRLRPSFIFGRDAATQQRRIFAGPFLPNRVLRPGVLPALPYPKGLRFQALHVDDVAAAYHLAATSEVGGAFNIAAGPVVRGADLAQLLETRLLNVPSSVVRTAVAAGWHLRIVPTEPQLLALAMRLPLLDTSRALEVLRWTPRRSSIDALGEFLSGVRDGAGAPTRPLAPDSITERAREVASLVGGRDS